MSTKSHFPAGAKKDEPAKKPQSPAPAGAVNLPADRPQSKPVRGWRQLQKLLPYMARCKGQVAIGLRRHPRLPFRQCSTARATQPDVAALNSPANSGVPALERPHAGDLLP